MREKSKNANDSVNQKRRNSIELILADTFCSKYTMQRELFIKWDLKRELVRFFSKRKINQKIGHSGLIIKIKQWIVVDWWRYLELRKSSFDPR